jgi:hypothetical protein
MLKVQPAVVLERKQHTVANQSMMLGGNQTFHKPVATLRKARSEVSIPSKFLDGLLRNVCNHKMTNYSLNTFCVRTFFRV